jgi:hypothetical protein
MLGPPSFLCLPACGARVMDEPVRVHPRRGVGAGQVNCFLFPDDPRAEHRGARGPPARSPAAVVVSPCTSSWSLANASSSCCLSATRSSVKGMRALRGRGLVSVR